MKDASLSDSQITALLHEYDGLRHELTAVSGSMHTLGGIGITIVAAVFGFMSQAERLEIALAIPALVLTIGTQMLRLQVNTRYIGIGLRGIEGRVNNAVGDGTLTWESTHNYFFGVPSSRNDGWAAVMRREPVNRLSNTVVTLLFAIALFTALILGAKYLLELDKTLPVRVILTTLLLLFYAFWGGILTWLTLVRSPDFIAEAEEAYKLAQSDPDPAQTSEKDT